MANHVQQYVVVWECLQQSKNAVWRSYSPAVSQILEKAYRSRLTQVLLGDADPTLIMFRVSLTSMVQICEYSEEACPVKRVLYPRSSPAGQGIRWDWLGDRLAEWVDYEMEAQIIIESSWTQGCQTIDLSQHFTQLPYIINFCNLTQVRKDTGFVRSIRRVQQATYPAALKNEVPEVRPVSTKPDASDKVASQKGKWLAGLINVVKSPIKNHSDSKGNNKSIHDVASASDKAVGTANKVKTKESNTGRSSGAKRDTPRSGLRLERRTLSNSSLDTVSTCLSQEDSFNNPYHQNKRMNMR